MFYTCCQVTRQGLKHVSFLWHIEIPVLIAMTVFLEPRRHVTRSKLIFFVRNMLGASDIVYGNLLREQICSEFRLKFAEAEDSFNQGDMACHLQNSQLCIVKVRPSFKKESMKKSNGWKIGKIRSTECVKSMKQNIGFSFILSFKPLSIIKINKVSYDSK